MNITAALTMVPRGAREESPVETGTLDILALVQSLAIAPEPPTSVADAQMRRSEFVAYDQQLKAALPLVKDIVSTMFAREQANDKAKALAEAELEEETESFVSTLTKETLGMAFRLVRVLVMGGARILVAAVGTTLELVGGAISFLIANPAVAVAVGIVALGFAGYYYFKSKGKEGKPVPHALQPKPAESAQAATPAGAPVQTAVPVVQAPAPAPAPASAAQLTATESSTVTAPSAGAAAARATVARDAAKTKATKISAEVSDALTNASKVVGVPLSLLSALAGVESSFGANTTATTSSARGLFQFIRGTWATMLKRYGAQYGVPANADPNDHRWAAILAAAMIKFEGYPAVSKVVSQPSITDIYLTHFLGSAGGTAFLKGYLANPSASASSLVSPSQAKANASIFTANGKDRSAQEVYDLFAARLQAQLNKASALIASAASDSGSVTAVPEGTAGTPGSVTTTASAATSTSGAADSAAGKVGAPQATAKTYDYVKLGRNQQIVRMES